LEVVQKQAAEAATLVAVATSIAIKHMNASTARIGRRRSAAA
jgi:hypothetical protein